MSSAHALNTPAAGLQVHRRTYHGVAIVVVEEHSMPITRFVLGFKHGAGTDPTGAAGSAYAMFELLMRGTQNMGRAEFNATSEELGSTVAAAAGHELGFLRGMSLKRHLPKTFGLAVDALLHPSFPEEEYRRYIEETVADIAMGRDADPGLVELFLRRELYLEHPFHRSAVGQIPDLKQLSLEAVRATYERLIRRDHLVVTFAGDITPDEAEALAAPLIDALPQGTDPNLGLPPLPELSGNRIVVVDKPDRTQVQMRIGRLGCTGDDPQALALLLGVMAFGGTFTSPLTREVRDERGWSYFASASFDRRRQYASPVVLRTAPAIDDAVNCLELQLQLYRAFAMGDLDPDAIEFTRGYLLNRFPFHIATAADVMVPALQAELIGTGPDDVFKLPEQLPRISVDDVHGALRHHLDPEQVAVTLVATADDIVPELERRFGADQVTVVNYLDGLG